MNDPVKPETPSRVPTYAELQNEQVMAFLKEKTARNEKINKLAERFAADPENKKLLQDYRQSITDIDAFASGLHGSLRAQKVDIPREKLTRSMLNQGFIMGARVPSIGTMLINEGVDMVGNTKANDIGDQAEKLRKTHSEVSDALKEKLEKFVEANKKEFDAMPSLYLKVGDRTEYLPAIRGRFEELIQPWPLKYIEEMHNLMSQAPLRAPNTPVIAKEKNTAVAV